MNAMTAAKPPSSEPADRTFAERAEPFRRELKVHCYRMVGSLHEADDLVQETYLRAWKNFDRFDGRGTFRAWLYRIATNACLDAIAARKNRQRVLRDERIIANAEMPKGIPAMDVAWLEPFPDSDIESVADEASNPEARYASREAVQLAFVAIIQQLPPRQRAAFLLCDVMGWSAEETASLVGGSVASVNSELQRGRETLAKNYPAGRAPSAAKPSAAQQSLLERYLHAWERLDLDAFAALLKEDATYTMPPLPQWFRGRAAIREFFATAFGIYSGYRMIPTSANGQPAFAGYSRPRTDTASPWTAHSIHVLTLENDEIAELTLFVKPDAPRLFQAFELPLEIAE
jgi:RNA polymerase sigma-70 factor (ECF subfamily)